MLSGLPNFYFHVTTAYNILRHCGDDRQAGLPGRLSERLATFPRGLYWGSASIPVNGTASSVTELGEQATKAAHRLQARLRTLWGGVLFLP